MRSIFGTSLAVTVVFDSTRNWIERPQWFANAHVKLDGAVASAYDFPVDLTDQQILERLLALNQQRAAEEATTRHVRPVKQGSRAKKQPTNSFNSPKIFENFDQRKPYYN
jgi:hypothetical protein